VHLCRSKSASLPTQLKRGLAPRDKDSPPTFLDFEFVAATSQTDQVKMTVTATDCDDLDDAEVLSRQQSVGLGSAAVHMDATATPVHS